MAGFYREYTTEAPDVTIKEVSDEEEAFKEQKKEVFEVFTLSQAGFPQRQIAEQLGFTLRQVGYTLRSGQVSPRRRTEKRTKLNSEQVDELVAFALSDGKKRHMSYLELAMHFSKWNVGESAIRGALTRRGYSRNRTRR
ncbi:hypothetical protein EPUL_001493 [Erysiphe pulchra]|uniref:Uncharacterized protein n=1 Tax=Erysiphe pulchra TaxID=225359 RepID=A0A2S4PWF2_9PEZI|nr:hypothetical protein EPUL_001493 [Erysiphe pulchra]